MTTYAVFDRNAKGAPAVVPDRFSWFAALLPPVFAVANGLWLVLLFWIALVAGLGYASLVIGQEAAGWLYVLVAVFIGFEAQSFRRDSLLIRGYRWAGDIVASAPDIAERDFLARQP